MGEQKVAYLNKFTVFSSHIIIINIILIPTCHASILHFYYYYNISRLLKKEKNCHKIANPTYLLEYKYTGIFLQAMLLYLLYRAM